jgi:2-polyprenyl-3-methyl-5-hydroxy-6-metoxy-1,4-benzoquinol methylase
LPTDRERLAAYGDEYFEQMRAHQRRASRAHQRLEAWKAREVARILQSGDILDVGCGEGDFLHRLQAEGNYRVTGIEMSNELANAARSEGLQVFAGRLLDVELPESTFDAVTFWHSLEHMPDPMGALRAASALLRPGGHVFVAVPSIDSAQARLFGKHWYHLDVPRHIVHFTRRGLEQMMASCGLETAVVVLGSPGHDVAGMRGSLVGLFPSGSGLWRIARRAAAAVGAGLGILTHAERLIHRPSTVLVVGRRRASEWLDRAASQAGDSDVN